MTGITSLPPAGGLPVPGNDWTVLDGIRPDEPPLVSVVVVHFEQHDDLDRTLRALAAQNYPADRLEIVVVDDGSEIAPTVPAGVRLVVQADEGFRAAAARNAGAAASSGTVLCFLDADTAPEPDYVMALTRLPALAPEAVTVGYRRHADLAGDTTTPVHESGPRNALPEPAWLAAEYARTGNLLDSDERSYRYLIGAVLACSRWFFDELGGFDESFTVYGGEDWEWAHRAWLAGGIFAHVPAAIAWHNGPDAAGRETGDRDEATRRKNGETVSLLPLISVPGAAGRGLTARIPDVVIVVPDGEEPAVFQCVDLLLQVMPTARVVVPPALVTLFDHDSRVSGSVPATRSRVLVEVSELFGVTDAESLGVELGAACARVGRGTLGSVVISGGGVELTVTSSRAAAREARWGAASQWTTERAALSMAPLGPGSNLAAYLGGW